MSSNFFNYRFLGPQKKAKLVEPHPDLPIAQVQVLEEDDVFEVDEDNLREEFAALRNRLINIIENHELLGEFIRLFNERALLKAVITEQDLYNNQSGSFTGTMLMWAASHNEYRLCRYLILNGASVNETSSNDYTALKYAAGKGSLELVKLLVFLGALINVRKQAASPILFAASRNDDEGRDICRFLLPGLRDFNLAKSTGYTLLMYAAKSAHAELCRSYIDRGADVNRKTNRKKNHRTDACSSSWLSRNMYCSC